MYLLMLRIPSQAQPIAEYFLSSSPATNSVFDGTQAFQSSPDARGGEHPYRTEAMSRLLSLRLRKCFSNMLQYFQGCLFLRLPQRELASYPFVRNLDRSSSSH